MITRGEHQMMSKDGIKIHQKGVYDIKDLVKSIQNYLEERKYTVQISTQSKNRDVGYEVLVGLKSERDMDDYSRFHINVSILIIEMEKVKIKNKNLDKGDMNINFKANIFLDYKNRWNKNFISRFLNLIYNNYIIKDKIKGDYERKVYLDLINLHNLVKEKLGLYLHVYGT